MARRYSRRGVLATAGLTALAGCLGGNSPTDGAGSSPESTAGNGAGLGVTPGTATERSPTEPGTGPPLVDVALPLPTSGEELHQAARSGGPPKDGIPAIDDPAFVGAGEADDRLDEADIVFGLRHGDDVKAYPQNILVWHEIVNDDVDGVPVSVTYCPLTGTAQGFDRGSTTFGVSGRLLNNNLIMYDRATENWWPQVLATAIPGPWNSNLAGNSLSEFRVVWTTWAAWKKHNPETRVLSTGTGYARNYSSDPYGSYNPPGGYYTNDNTLFPQLNPDDRFPAKHVVMGVRTPDGAAAVPKDVLRERGLVEGAIDGSPMFWVYDAGLDTGYAYWNPDRLDFSYDAGSVAGPEDTHPPAELPLDRALTFDAMWFAWAGFYPETSVHE